LGCVVTIGIAAFGPNAARAIVRALSAIEAVGRGAIGGFVSLVAITATGHVERRQTQQGGSALLFPGGPASMPAIIADARIAGLMSSGPNRPEPLSQFTPADGQVGIVTGHRMPNTIGASGMNVNDEVLERMRGGEAPADAVRRVTAANPDVDAGLIALAIDGSIAAADTSSVARRGDTGRAMIGSASEGAAVAVLHNAIRPHRPIAALAAEIAMDILKPSDRCDGWITFRKGARALPGLANSVSVGADGLVDSITVENPRLLVGRWNFGIGYETPVVAANGAVAALVYEPYMVLEDGRLSTIDGCAELAVPIRSG
jgi:hypothetical protein